MGQALGWDRRWDGTGAGMGQALGWDRRWGGTGAGVGQALGWDLHSIPALSWQTKALLTICCCSDLSGLGGAWGAWGAWHTPPSHLGTTEMPLSLPGPSLIRGPPAPQRPLPQLRPHSSGTDASAAPAGQAAHV